MVGKRPLLRLACRQTNGRKKSKGGCLAKVVVIRAGVLELEPQPLVVVVALLPAGVSGTIPNSAPSPLSLS